MEDTSKRPITINDYEQDEDAKASADIWKYALGFANVAVVRCAIELKIPDVIENHNSQPVALADLSSAISCSSPVLLHRIMRFLAHQGIFKEQSTKDGLTGYANTPLSRRMISDRGDGRSMAPLILMESSPVMLAPWLKLSKLVSGSGSDAPFDAAHGKDMWAYGTENPEHTQLFNEGLACDTRRIVPTIARECGDVFKGIGSLVDVGGGTGDAMGIVVKEFPWIKGINFDLPHVVQVAKKFDGVENVGGDMFVSPVPKADAVFLKSLLHDWGDEECIEILKRCREAIPKENGKVIIVETVVGERRNDDDKFEFVRLMLDMTMMAHNSRGKERTVKEWDYVLKEAGFVRYEVRDTSDVYSVIVAYLS